MTPTDLDELEDLIRSTIEAVDPRKTYPGGPSWESFAHEGERQTGRMTPIRTGPPASGARSRRFRILWRAGNYRTDGIWTDDVVETEVELRVRVDYAAKASEIAARDRVVIDDFFQLRDVLCSIKGYTNGLMLVEAQRVEEIGGEEDPQIARYDLVYIVRYLAAQAATG